MPEPRYEIRDVNPRGVLLAIGALALLIVTALIVCRVYLHALTSTRRQLPSFTARPQFMAPAPEVTANQRRLLSDYQQAQATLLSSAQWLDNAHTIARIPIEQAMNLVVQRGAEAGPGQPTPQPQSPLEIQRLKAVASPAP